MEVWWPPIKVYFTPFITMKLRVFEAFAGVGSQRMALRNLGIDHEVVAIAEIDKFAIKSYEAIHGETNNLGDISQIETADIPDHDLFTYSFPCQDISVAGKGLGLSEGSGTRSGLLWECQKVIAVKKPKYLLLENVKNLVGKKHKHNFDKWLEWLEEQGYTNYYQILNAKDYGVPQNRERVFVVSILGEHEPYEFPEPVELELRLKDVLEDEVDEKFYLSEERVNQLTLNWDKVEANKDLQVVANTSKTGYNSENVYHENGVSPTLAARDYKGPKQVLQVGQYDTAKRKNSNAYRVYDAKGVAPTLDTMQGGWRQPSVVIAASRGRYPENPSDGTVGSPTEQRLEINKQGTSNTITTVQKDNYVVESKEDIDTELMVQIQEKMMLTDDEWEYGVLKQELFDKFGTSRVCARCKNQVLHSDLPNYDFLCFECDENLYTFETESVHFLIGSTQKNAGITDGDYTTTLTSSMGTGGGHVPMHNITPDFRIRKLSPLECWRLMGFSDDDFHKAEAVNSNTQLYKQAGNSIVVDVLEGIFKQLLDVAE